MLTLYRTRKLHTLMNSLVAFMCLTNLPLCLSTGLTPYLINHRAQALCRLRHGAMEVSHCGAFVTVVLITVLRYLMVVHNRRFAPSRANVLRALAAPLLVAAARNLPLFDDMYAKCGDTFGHTTDGFVIVVNRPATTSTPMLIGLVVLYSVGLLLMALCHARILVATVSSRRRLRAHRRTGRRHSLRRPKVPSVWSLQVGDGNRPAQTADRASAEKGAQRAAANGGGDGGSGEAAVPWWRCATLTRLGSPSRPRLPPVEEVDAATASGRGPAPPAVGGRTGAVPDTGLRNRANGSAAAGGGASSGAGGVEHSISAADGTNNPAPSTNTSASEAGPSSGCGRTPAGSLTLRADRLTAYGARPGAPPAAVAGPRRRVDVVASAALLCCMAVYVLAYAPFVAFIVAERRLSCVLLPPLRIVSWLLFNCSVGLTAVLSPLTFVIFNGEFRRAFRRTCYATVRR
ncbi:hypothetical protein FJT64_014838 [Amphibalanus amphitrite]|uniref:G-protein coupled receptors family 1 profile domain-containing protein n=1 Tax=Amphibalanus amphitrite TaxID=1232801 RepID=A0A6A4UXS6_AMPAM|nr:hypothetical protein FJT64_014838 [Amphibalanus amphitrite]